MSKAKFAIIIIPLLLCLNLFAEQRIFDFDNSRQNQKIITKELVKKIDMPSPLSSESVPNSIIEFRFFRITEIGQEIEVLPEIDSSGKAYYKFKPNEKIKAGSLCSCPSCPSSYKWRACDYYAFYPQQGGHNHNGNVPPYATWEGLLYPSPMCAPVTPINEYGYIYFKTPAFAARAEHKTQYFGTCEDTYFNTIDIKIDGLILLPPAWQDSLHGGVTYYNLINNHPYSTYHPINHFGKPQTITLLKEIAWQYHREFPASDVLNINDISLRWGGKFDVEADWTGRDHIYHRYGRQADVRLWSIPEQNRERFKRICCDLGIKVELHGKNYEDLSPSQSYVWENIDFNLSPWDSLTAEELDMRVPHYHLVFPKYDSEVDDPLDQQSQGCPSSTQTRRESE